MYNILIECVEKLNEHREVAVVQISSIVIPGHRSDADMLNSQIGKYEGTESVQIISTHKLTSMLYKKKYITDDKLSLNVFGSQLFGKVGHYGLDKNAQKNQSNHICFQCTCGYIRHPSGPN